MQEALTPQRSACSQSLEPGALGLISTLPSPNFMAWGKVLLCWALLLDQGGWERDRCLPVLWGSTPVRCGGQE